ncbi:unnamed protein product [Pleuronectes platessa]|uniref:Uncharacterized protein n=1 Tax=Pleuronectes platessa TaxID=8262 RepID=A0A9N7V2J2_PLEPL|nr:unnamed protein product [Pleuronectes platessa]
MAQRWRIRSLADVEESEERSRTPEPRDPLHRSVEDLPRSFVETLNQTHQHVLGPSLTKALLPRHLSLGQLYKKSPGPNKHLRDDQEKREEPVITQFKGFSRDDEVWSRDRASLMAVPCRRDSCLGFQPYFLDSPRDPFVLFLNLEAAQRRYEAGWPENHFVFLSQAHAVWMRLGSARALPTPPRPTRLSTVRMQQQQHRALKKSTEAARPFTAITSSSSSSSSSSSPSLITGDDLPHSPGLSDRENPSALAVPILLAAAGLSPCLPEWPWRNGVP